LALGFFVGLRVAEAYEIKLADFFAKNVLASGSSELIGKSGKETLPLAAPVLTWLTAQPRGT